MGKGASGLGEVVSVERSRGSGHPGSLGIALDFLYAADGDKIRLTSARNTEQGENKTGAASIATIVSWAFLGLPGLFAHNFVHGRDIELDASTPIDAYVQDTVHVVATMRNDPDVGYAHY